MNNLRSQFPLLSTKTYLDSAAMMQKPQSVISAIVDFYTNFAINNHSINSDLGFINQTKIANIRHKCAKLIEASFDEVIFTSGTTDSINLFAQMFQNFIKPGDEILVSYLNHSSNLTPWLHWARTKGAKVVYTTNFVSEINNKTKIIAFSQINNSLQINLDLKTIWEKAKQFNAIVVNDATQAISVEKVSLKFAHIIAFSTNKFFGPTGLGVLAIQKQLLSMLKPTTFGGGATSVVNFELDFAKGLQVYEPGTPNLAGLWGFDAALDFFNQFDYAKIQDKLKNLSNYAFLKLSEIENIEIYSQKSDHIILFNIKGFSAQDISSALGHENIYVRSGNFCVPLISNVLNEQSFVRISLAIYNNYQDIDKIVEFLKRKDFFNFV
ncbi:aminotransferase class V-fold PLP-dependent enzyme [Mesomycoplasma bovoculi]|uniref:Aminotransferase class V n=1 Tax=Mesomycoplasma bovoculi M165/69 TaxID=743966 RepID=W5UTA9_9BACT|nr:aminotransferase class V-fold PLP-dependent enzyme [Mesomycoplasma bovoculi]AHH45444.1 aminotransferase class V [Mesomycoplasma bovoculi M165/69]